MFSFYSKHNVQHHRSVAKSEFSINFIYSYYIIIPLQKASNHVTFVVIKQAIERKSNNLDLMKHLDQYISLISKNFKVEHTQSFITNNYSGRFIGFPAESWGHGRWSVCGRYGACI